MTIARERLRLLLGLPADDAALDRLENSGSVELCGSLPDLLKAARRSAGLRAAELTIEAAAARLGWEKSRILTLTAVLDANAEGIDGFESGPGIDVSIPLFNRNQGGKLRAQSELERAHAAFVQLRHPRLATTSARPRRFSIRPVSRGLPGGQDRRATRGQSLMPRNHSPQARAPISSSSRTPAGCSRRACANRKSRPTSDAPRRASSVPLGLAALGPEGRSESSALADYVPGGNSRHGSRGRDAAPPASAPAAAKVTAAVPEAALTTLTLTGEAQKRLGIETGVAERRTITRSRSVGGEIVPAGGAEITVTAPVAGTLGRTVGRPRWVPPSRRGRSS